MSRRLQTLLSNFHREQSGAVMILLLAAFLVLFMLALVLYDAGQSSRDKMRTQVAADTSAFAHSTVKARGMNMIVYGNIIKRMFYAYMHTYAAGWTALLGAFAIDDVLCVKLNADACSRVAKELAVIGAELAESTSNIAALVSPDGRSQREVAALDATQAYIAAITPWWAWVENVTRAYDNADAVTLTWPPPSSRITAVKDWINTGAAVADKLVGTDIVQALPSNTYQTDRLPVVRRDRDAVLDMWNVKLESGALLAHVSYCDNYVFSFEALTLQAQYMVESANIWTMKAAFIPQATSLSLSCMAAGVVYGGNVLDWKIEGAHFGHPARNAIGGAILGNNDEVSDDWLTRTSNLTISYKPRAGAMSNAEASGRGKYGFIPRDYTGVGASPLYRNSGYWSIARSEVAYVPQGVLAGLSGMFGALGQIPGLTKLIDATVYTPDMWTPAWTGRLRPVALPDEQVATSTTDEPIGLDAMFWDSVAYLVLAGGLMEGVDQVTGGERIDFADAVNDLEFLLRATRGYGPDELEGITK